MLEIDLFASEQSLELEGGSTVSDSRFFLTRLVKDFPLRLPTIQPDSQVVLLSREPTCREDDSHYSPVAIQAFVPTHQEGPGEPRPYT